MKAALLRAFGNTVGIETVPDPTCPRDGTVIKLEACGVCRSDHHAWVGADPDVALPHIMGHELAGVVAEVGPDCTAFKQGDRVTAPFILGCGTCSDCSAGQPTVCESQDVIGFTFWGAFAEYVAIPHADYNLVHIPEAIGFAEAAGMGCRVTTAWRALSDRGALRPGEWLAVHGSGGVGLSAVLLAKSMGAQVVAVDISDDALDKARALGADAVVNARGGGAPEEIRELTDGGAHVSVDALGIYDTFDASLKSLRKLGRHVQVGMPVGDHATVPLPLLELVYARQLTLHGMRGLGAQGFPALFAKIEAGELNIAQLVTARLPLSGVTDALRAMDGAQQAGVAVITEFDR
ncbi:zinc-dependent alcohol dehydrogenase family protein [Cognatishimia sp. MH4019]|uniref:zinc-dependent alcohol dehydrogenase family protein n=1 Tax=Cognatishimia sp. MH4019 TaxID=2854030 RepID=UPI001CD53C46|nr:zinc-dependent alcohol dehydrogenase family protein [Cognatishimia sp. MH4019]